MEVVFFSKGRQPAHGNPREGSCLLLGLLPWPTPTRHRRARWSTLLSLPGHCSASRGANRRLSASCVWPHHRRLKATNTVHTFINSVWPLLFLDTTFFPHLPPIPILNQGSNPMPKSWCKRPVPLWTHGLWSQPLNTPWQAFHPSSAPHLSQPPPLGLLEGTDHVSLISGAPSCNA